MCLEIYEVDGVILRKGLKILVGGGTLKGVLIWEGTVNSYILGNNCKQTFLIH